MSQHYDFQNGEFATAVAAATFVIHSLEEAEADYRLRKPRDDFGKSKAKIKTTKRDSAAGSVRVTRHISSREVKVAGETSARKPTEEDQSQQENAFRTRKPSLSSSVRPMNQQQPSDTKLMRNSTLSQVVETKADSWEKAQLRKINRRYERMKSKIIDWENAKKMRAKFHGEKKKREMELRKASNMQHYKNKIARIDLIAGGARGQLEEKRGKEESEVKEKARHIRSKKRSPLKCLCC